MGLLTLVLGVWFAISLATNIMFFYLVATWLSWARRDPRRAIETFFGNAKALRGYTVQIGHDGHVTINCDEGTSG